MRTRAILGPAAIIATAVILDQAVKWLVERELPMHRQIDVLPMLSLYRTHNTGIAFSMLSGFGTAGVIAVVLAVIAGVLILWSRTSGEFRYARFGFALIVGGAIGNLIDRVSWGYVIDYILFHTPSWSFAIFNLADALITVGAGFVLLDELLGWRAERRAADAGKPGAED